MASAAASSSTPSLAILDDYHSLAAPYFKSIPSLTDIASYPETLSPHDPSDFPKLVSRLKPYTIISTMRERTPFPANLLSELPNLKLLLTTGMRNASLELNATKEHGIIVTGTTGKGVPSRRLNQSNSGGDGEVPKPKGFDSTAQHTWSLILALTSRVAVDSLSLQGELRTPLPPPSSSDGNSITEGQAPWQSGFSVALAGKTLGIVGLGRLGAQVARTALLGLGMRVIAWSESLTQSKADAQAAEFGLGPGSFESVDREDVFRRADVVSVHYVLSARSVGIVGAKELGLMKSSAFLVNTARGPLVDEDALYESLVNGRIRGAGLDVFSQEPLPRESRWRTTAWRREGRGDVVLSPHMGYVEESNLRRWYEEQAENVERWIKGEEVFNQMN